MSYQSRFGDVKDSLSFNNILNNLNYLLCYDVTPNLSPFTQKSIKKQYTESNLAYMIYRPTTILNLSQNFEVKQLKFFLFSAQYKCTDTV